MTDNATAIGAYVPPIYESNMAVKSMHTMPRFGLSDQVSILFSNNQANARDYVFGISFLAFFIISVIFSWGVSLLLLKLCGICYDSSFLSGGPMKEPKPTSFPRQTYQTPIWIRSIFLLSCAIVSIFSVIVAADSYFKTQDLVEISRARLKDVSNLVQLSKELTTNIRDIGDRSESKRETLSNYLDVNKNPCFSVNATGLDQGVPDFRSQVESVQDTLANLKGFVRNQLGNVETYQNRIIKLTEEIDNYIIEYKPKEWWFLLFTISVSFICTAMFVGTLWAWTAEVTPMLYQIAFNWVLLPFFIIFVFSSCVFCCLAGTGSIVIADFCTGNANPGTPDSSVIQIIDYQNLDKDSLLYKSAVYYVDGCKTEFPFGFLPDYVNKLREANRNLGVLNDYFSNVGFINTINYFCPEINLQEIEGTISNLGTDITSLFAETARVIDFLGCEKMNTLYSEITHNIVCTQGSRTSFFVFVAFVFISFFGMMMITFRSAWLGVEYYNGSVPMEKEIPTILVPNETEPNSKHEKEISSKSANPTEGMIETDDSEIKDKV